VSTPAARPARVDPDPKAVGVEVSGTALRIMLSDGWELSAPLAWFPRLAHATPEQRAHWEVAGAGYGIHWPDVDEDVSVRALIGRPT